MLLRKESKTGEVNLFATTVTWNSKAPAPSSGKTRELCLINISRADLDSENLYSFLTVSHMTVLLRETS